LEACTTADRPLVVQFASNNAKDFADATELVAPYVEACFSNQFPISLLGSVMPLI